MLDGWGAVSLHPEKAQWHSLHAALSAQVDLAQTATGLQEAVACRALGSSEARAAKVFLFIFLFPQGKKL